MALTFERKPDKGGETNHIGCIGIELSSLTDIKGLDTLAEEKGIGARGTAKLALQMGFYLDRPGVSVFGDLTSGAELSEVQQKFAKENA